MKTTVYINSHMYILKSRTYECSSFLVSIADRHWKTRKRYLIVEHKLGFHPSSLIHNKEYVLFSEYRFKMWRQDRHRYWQIKPISFNDEKSNVLNPCIFSRHTSCLWWCFICLVDLLHIEADWRL